MSEGPVASTERAVTRLLNLVRLYRIRSKIIVFALLATLIPSVSMGWLSYRNNRSVLQEKISEELANLAANASRRLDLWFKESLYEVRVFSSSYEVSENLDQINRTAGTAGAIRPHLNRLQTYLGSVAQRFVDYEALVVVDVEGKVVASSTEESSGLSIPDGWLEQVRAGEPVVGEPSWDSELSAAVMLFAESIRRAQDGQMLGVLLAKLNFRSIENILRTHARGDAVELFIIANDGQLITGSRPRPDVFMNAQLDSGVVRQLFAKAGLTHEFTGADGVRVVGTLEEVGRLGWGVVAMQERATAFAPIARLQSVTVFLVLGSLVIVGLAAYLLGLTIVRPLDRLTAGASHIAAGNLDVSLPVLNRGELGSMTEVFNYMAEQLRRLLSELDKTNKALREKNQKLQQISITDSLTTLFNRKHMMETLASEAARSQRYNRPYSILLLDIDHFKKFNDTCGHLAGDEVLHGVAMSVKASLRGGDYAARYGGEEFLVLLPETGPADAAQSAERIRSRVERERLGAEASFSGITISIGVASYPEMGGDSEEVMRHADDAMYVAKRRGRNQVVVAEAGSIAGSRPSD